MGYNSDTTAPPFCVGDILRYKGSGVRFHETYPGIVFTIYPGMVAVVSGNGQRKDSSGELYGYSKFKVGDTERDIHHPASNCFDPYQADQWEMDSDLINTVLEEKKFHEDWMRKFASDKLPLAESLP